MDKEKDAFDGFKKLLGGKEKFSKIVLILGIAGMLFIFISEIFPKSKIRRKNLHTAARKFHTKGNSSLKSAFRI